jgi:hypothetical protein
MFNERLFALIVALTCLPIVANAQSGSAPVSRERELAQIIREAGYDCSHVESITNSPAPPPGWESLRPEIATCQNGKRFWLRGRGAGTYRPWYGRCLPVREFIRRSKASAAGGSIKEDVGNCAFR